MHPRGQRCSSLTYGRYSLSSRLVRDGRVAERPDKASAALSVRVCGPTDSSSADSSSAWLVKSALGATPDFHHGLLARISRCTRRALVAHLPPKVPMTATSCAALSTSAPTNQALRDRTRTGQAQNAARALVQGRYPSGNTSSFPPSESPCWPRSARVSAFHAGMGSLSGG